MGESRAWVEHGARVHLLVPEAGAAEFSPDDAYLAWVDGLAPTIVHVTEVATMRSVATLHGGRVAALGWRGADTLCVFQHLDGEAWMRAHAIPDAGVVAKVRLPWVRGWMRVQTSGDTRSALVTWPRSLALGVVSLGACVLRGDRLESAREVDLAAIPALAPEGGAAFVEVALSPDGDTVAIGGRDARGRRALWCAFASCEGEVRARVTIPWGTTPAMVTWVDARQVLTMWGNASAAGRETILARVDVAGEVARVATCGQEFLFPSPVAIDLDPARARAVVIARVSSPSREATRALAIPCDTEGEATRTIPSIELSRQATLAAGQQPLGGGACWDAHGHLVTLAPVTRVEARLSRRASPDDTAHAELHFALTGASPRALTLTPSPTRRHALARWETRDRGEGVETSRRLALLALK